VATRPGAGRQQTLIAADDLPAKLTGDVVGASVGALLVFYNITVIAYALPFVGQALFVSPDPIQGALNTLALVSSGYVAKPIAQAIAGSIADRHGRRPVLMAASLLTAATSLGLALLPTVHAIGVAAPILFTALIALQAAAAGSEWPLLAAYVAESTSPGRRGFLTSFASLCVCSGWLLALLVPLLLHTVLSDAQYGDWGWRVAFGPAVILGVLAYLLRRRVQESVLFRRVSEQKALSPTPLREVFRCQPVRWLALTVQVSMISAGFYLTVAFPTVFVTLADKFDHVESLTVGAVALGCLVAGITLGGTLGDRFGPRPVAGIGYLLLAVVAYPAFVLMSEGRLGLALLGAALCGCALSLPAGVYEAWIVSSFRVRYTGSATTCNGVAIAVCGAPVLWLSTRLVQDHGYLAPAALLVAVGAIGMVSTRTLSPSINDPVD
jgi:MFS transporter, MHS family, proline/betaine transporter